MKKLLICFLSVCFCLACNKSTDVQIPAYIQIDNYYTKVAHNLTDSTQGTNSQNFTDMLVYANGKSYGIYPLGSKIPILNSGATNFIIRGVVRMNGLDILRTDYEVMKGCDTLLNIKPGQVIHVTPQFQYFSTAQFRWMDNFESNSTQYGSVVTDYGTQRTLTATTYTPGFGNYGSCLALKPTADTTTASVHSATAIVLPTGGVGVYMELNYQSNLIIQVYISSDGGATKTDCGGIFPSTDWKKTYINLTEQVSALQASHYTLYFVSTYDGNPGHKALIDNIKIVTAQ